MLKPRRLLHHGLRRYPPRRLSFRVGNRQRPQQHALHFGQRCGPCFHAIPPPQRRLPQLLAQHRRVDAELLRRVGGKLVPRQLFRDAPDVRQKKIQRLHLLLRAGAGELHHCSCNQIIRLPSRPPNCLFIGIHAPFADKSVRVQSAIQRDQLDGKTLLGQQGDRLFRGIRAGRVGIEIDDHVRRVPPQNRHLLLGEGRPAGRDHVLNSAQEDADAVHLPLHQQGKTYGPDRRLGLVEVEEHLPLRIERRLRRIDVLRASLFTLRRDAKRARRKRNHAATLVADGEHNPLAESVVNAAVAAVLLLLRTEEAARAQRRFVGHAAQAVAQGVETVGRVADAEFLDSFVGKPAAGQVLARQRPFWPAHLLLKPRGCGLVQVQQFRTQPRLHRFLRRRELAFG